MVETQGGNGRKLLLEGQGVQIKMRSDQIRSTVTDCEEMTLALTFMINPCDRQAGMNVIDENKLQGRRDGSHIALQQ